MQAEIYVDRLIGVTAVPLAALYAAGKESYVFVRGANDELRPAKVTIGQANETHVQVLEGISAGQEVLILQSGQGRELLEKAGIKVEPATKPSDEAPGATKRARKPRAS